MQAKIYLLRSILHFCEPRLLFSKILDPFLLLFYVINKKCTPPSSYSCNKKKSSYPPRLLDLKRAFSKKVSFQNYRTYFSAHRFNMFFFLQNEEAPVPRICYSMMKHVEGDIVSPRDCILLASGNRKKDLPFVAKVTALWENPDDGECTYINNSSNYHMSQKLSQKLQNMFQKLS